MTTLIETAAPPSAKLTGPDTSPPTAPVPSTAVPQALLVAPASAQPGAGPTPVPAGPDWGLPALIVALGLFVGLVALILWRRSIRIEPDTVFRVLDGDAATAGTGHVEFPPVDLHQPIFGEAAWRAIRTHADDAVYLNAVEVMRARYAESGHPMALAQLLRETMVEARIGFREAVLRLAGQSEATRPDATKAAPVLDEDGQPIDLTPEDDPPVEPEAGATMPEPIAYPPEIPRDPRWVVDLSRPIGVEGWVAIHAHATQHGYTEAANAVQAQQRTVIDRMLLPNTLRDLMRDPEVSFAAAMTHAASHEWTRPRAGLA